MKHLIPLALLILPISPALAQQPPYAEDQFFSSGQTWTMTKPTVAPNLIVTCGGGSVTINTTSGAVTFENCTPDDGAKQFWEAVTRMFPGNVGSQP